jgi:fermentation-respiration switch protein FrsA (DUF1100 family)
MPKSEFAQFLLDRGFPFLKWLVIIYGTVLVMVYLAQSRLVYMPAREIVWTPKEMGLVYEDLQLVTEDQVKIHAWWIPNSASRKTILFCHGNGGNISYRQGYIRVLHQLGFNLLLFDYRGYGRSEGSPSEIGTYKDGERAWDYLTNTQAIAPADIYLYGESLGGGIASYLAQQKCQTGVGGLILGSTFTSIPDRAQELFPFLPVHLLSQYRYPNLERLAYITCPVLVLHSPQDEIIPFHHGQTLFAHARSPKTFVQLTGDHNTGFLQSLTVYEEGLRQFAQLVP